MKKIKRNILLNPGPATTTDTVKQAQVVPDICPRETEFQVVMDGIREDLVKIVHGGTDYASVLFGGSGTSAMDATLASVVPPDGKILLLINGAYGKRMQQITKTYDIATSVYEVEWGTALDWRVVDQMLSNDRTISHIAMVHHETTTGILNPLEPFLAISKKYNLTTLADTISSYAGIPIDLRETPVDFLMSTSNKCIQGMAGLAFVICKNISLEKLSKFKGRTFYLDLYKQYDYFERTGQMRFTPPVQVTYALRQAIDEYFEEGESNRWDRYSKSYKTLIDGLTKLGFRFLLGDDVKHSRILTTIYEPDHPNYDFNDLHDRLYERGFTIYPGKVSDKDTFRLSVLGAIDHTDIRDFLVNLEEVLDEMDVEIRYSRF
ncbi:MAG: 2-aminoethylphosphonate--pyruvate transaminase [Candidatus Marinimicrobia bacterium]|nr:2-aminoethylphosphonate--pyruvate transaminase [Candidatus Neomarinimicrobiota bacterium]MCF7829244.1 2-aminoethylphosphonate--pyruvate transaminase [Candidatus Neomarinimicrobiota bacterium]MCF7881103.1 2-aminoethylphosphonate--pyruvate transaminase [Candidatus Neomarinimicrobiota bacterium]